MLDYIFNIMELFDFYQNILNFTLKYQFKISTFDTHKSILMCHLSKYIITFDGNKI